LLHGHPFDEEHWVRLGVDEVADDGIRSDAYPPLIIVMPDGDSSEGGIYVNTSGGERSIEGLVVDELMPHIDATYQTRTDREARAIGGISRGGVWSLEIAFRHPDLFGAVGAHSPALSVNYPHPLYDPYSLAAEPGVKELRIYLDAGDVDWARTGTRRLHETLEEEGVAHEYVLGEGSHVDEYWSKMLPAYLAFYTAPWPHPENW
jgi:enterochelin esterase-like enzyme